VVDPASGDALAAPHTYVSDIHDGDVAVFTDYHAMIASGLVDAVNDFTTLAVHHEVGITQHCMLVNTYLPKNRWRLVCGLVG
jgi:hypothetical protein